MTPEQQRALEKRRKFSAAIEAKSVRAAAPIKEPMPASLPMIVIKPEASRTKKSTNAARIAELQKRIGRDRKNGVCKDVSPAHIIDACAAYYDVRSDHVISPRRHPGIVLPRHVAMYLMRDLLALPFRAVGAKCGGRDHATAIHATQNISRLIKTNPSVAADIAAIRGLLRGEATE